LKTEDFMGWLDIIEVVVTGGQSLLIDKEIDVGGQVLKVSIDAANEVVKIGEDIYKAIPAVLLFPGAGPLAGLLRKELGNDLLLLTPLGLVPSLTVFINGSIAVLDLLHIIQTRNMIAEELEVARFVFGGSIGDPARVLLTNIAGAQGRAFTVPLMNGNAAINLGAMYVNDGPLTKDTPILMHELTHVWQIQRTLFPEIFLCDAGILQGGQALGGPDPYIYASGSQWNTYNLEQEAMIVQNWVGGTTAAPFSIGSPLFRYINGNLRPADNGAGTASGGSIRARFREARTNRFSLRLINPTRPTVTWLH
jgi:hypothetical protein